MEEAKLCTVYVYCTVVTFFKWRGDVQNYVGSMRKKKRTLKQSFIIGSNFPLSLYNFDIIYIKRHWKHISISSIRVAFRVVV